MSICKKMAVTKLKGGIRDIDSAMNCLIMLSSKIGGSEEATLIFAELNKEKTSIQKMLDRIESLEV